METAAVDLSKLSDIVKNEVVIKTVYDGLIKKVNSVHVSNADNLVKKSGNNTKNAVIGKKTPDHDHNDKYNYSKIS